MSEVVRFGYLLSEKDICHTSINEMIATKKEYKIDVVKIDPNKSIYNQGKFDIIIHKVSDYLYDACKNDEKAIRILSEIKNYHQINPEVVFIDPPSTVLGLADRRQMFKVMNICKFECNGIKVDVPRWEILNEPKDIEIIKNSDFRFPIICKICNAGESPECHSMQLIFNKNQLDSLKMFPCVAQEFKNHQGTMSKIFVFGDEYFTCTRPSIRNFPVNGQQIDQIESISFFSHDVAKLSAKTFLNNYQNGFVHKHSSNGDQILDDKVTKEILKKLTKNFNFSLLGVDILITDDNKTYNIVDINFLPSFDGVENCGARLNKMIHRIIKEKKFVQYWTD